MASPRNPFPGMNPFLERSWSDTHTRLIGYISDTLAGGGLPGGLRARAEEYLMVEEADRDDGSARADVAVVEPWKRGDRPSWSAAEPADEEVVLTEPELVLRASEI